VFLAHFGLDNLRDLPGIDELRAAGLLDPVDEAVKEMGSAMAFAGETEPTDSADGLATDEESA
jgi:segregation and condensation protein B